MSYATRPIGSHVRGSSVGHSLGASGQSAALVQKIEDKKAELAALKQLQQLSAGVADQMQILEEKLSTLANGTEAVAAVLSNWHNVLRAINMASMKLPKPKNTEEQEDDAKKEETPLPQTLVRIPTQSAALLPQLSSGETAD
ncbi:hypothetical protein EJ05DRAFT_498664 [Pseudovirgaria hyperparasitica]|uniref:DASH complex subunit DAD2 n=1 Tax=Pseudovirgaria hyperparasitica TaxID=470096 RepID=A0A6A6WBW5_9PEZI|nr:uncharacterized protein EJ05DRAFT_498664 [Pseudovirgaria hyperparasitica]KAF2759450.1 hypothetical protein EJ05DRAFT_498664 [Pseudovirgaria hyperparasitica]